MSTLLGNEPAAPGAAMASVDLYQAGAGSGKTYTITQQIVQRLADGSTRPESILATTFTRKAAAELKDRIQTRLLHPEDGDPQLGLEDRLALAGAVDGALIGTVHSVGHQILARYALHLGISPILEPIEEKAQELHLRRIMAEMPRAGLHELDRLARRLGVEKPQDLVRKLLDEKRGNGIVDDAFAASMQAGIERFIQVISGQNSVPLGSFEAFYAACRDALDAMAGNGDETATSGKARHELADLIREGREAWQAWGKVAKLKWAKKSEGDAAGLVAMARRANVHADLHADLRAFNACLVERVFELQSRYLAYKTSHGLVDFGDLEEQFLRILQHPDIRADIGQSLDLVVVDEFQDTNPIQLAIFQELASLAKASLWVGDQKQAIYGFRGTDPQLMDDVLATVPEGNRKTLTTNYRSHRGLVEAVNAIFSPLFGDGTSLQPNRREPGRIERWKLAGRNKDLRTAALLAQMQELLAEEDPGDVAVLVRKRDQATAVAAGLQGIGVPALVQTSGLLSTREGEMVLAGLRLVADRRDHLAAATIRNIEDEQSTPQWFTDALVDRAGVFESPSVAAVQAIDARTLPPSGVIGAVTQALRLPDRIAAWGQPARRAANLDELLSLGARFEDEAEQEGKAATLTALIYWLEDLRAKDEDLLGMPAGVSAVRIMTLHAAKGLEWPVVVMYLDGTPNAPHPFKVHVEGGDAAHGKPLDGRSIRYWPYPFGTTPYNGLCAEGSGVQDAAKASPEGVALLDAAGEEARRLMYVGFTRAKRTLILAEGKSALSVLDGLDDVLPDEEAVAECMGAAYAVRPCAQEPAPGNESRGGAAWFEEAAGPQDHADRYWSPAKAPAEPCQASAAHLPGNHPFPAAVKTDDWNHLGQAVHNYLAALPALGHLGDDAKRRHAEACLTRWGRLGDIEAAALVQAGDRLEAWAAQQGATDWHVEVPAAGPRSEGGQWNGIIDLVLAGPDGSIVVDHKSADWREKGWTEKASQYSGQLRIYRELVEGKRATIHLVLGGGMVDVGVPLPVNP